MYLLFWQKPADVHDPTLIKLDGEKFGEARKRLLNGYLLLSKRAYNLDYTIIPVHLLGEAINFLVPLLVPLLVPIVLCIAYGAIHMAAWHFEFPSDIESQLWKICCIVVVVGCVSTPALIEFSVIWSNLSKKTLSSFVDEFGTRSTTQKADNVIFCACNTVGRFRTGGTAGAEFHQSEEGTSGCLCCCAVGGEYSAFLEV
ncbi:hypothetical protein K440DRAFT_82875 [Wilcoxina mikolae CBS 423.85]|nr:hypothetical protein K440DRAFT_82875 [Wilcoxina mikolae CBS 423.85]